MSCQIFVYCDHPIGQNEVIEEEPNGKIDFSGAVPQKDGSLCVTKVKYLEKLEKQQVKECWHQNVTGMVPHAVLSIFLINGKKYNRRCNKSSKKTWFYTVSSNTT